MKSSSVGLRSCHIVYGSGGRKWNNCNKLLSVRLISVASVAAMLRRITGWIITVRPTASTLSSRYWYNQQQQQHSAWAGHERLRDDLYTSHPELRWDTPHTGWANDGSLAMKPVAQLGYWILADTSIDLPNRKFSRRYKFNQIMQFRLKYTIVRIE